MTDETGKAYKEARSELRAFFEAPKRI